MASAGDAGLVPDGALDRLYRRSGAERWGLTRPPLAAAVARAVRKEFGDVADVLSGVASSSSIEHFVDRLHAEDLGLAAACAEGSETGWEHFVLTYRPELYRAARAITGESAARELADSLYADLFGLTTPDGVRQSLFRYYHGRAKLSTWLRSVLSQRHVDGIRAARRLTSLDDPDEGTPEPVAAVAAVEPDATARMRVAATCLSVALAGLDAPSRLRLAYYYVHGLTLAEAGRLFGEHEATASRKLEKARTALRRLIETALSERGVRVEDVDSWGEVATRAWDAALADALGVAAPGAAAPAGATTERAGAQEPARPSFKGERTP